ncbi:MAG: DUF4417 domain-containing protein [Prevotellaceae bacterium]|nr:DUF4417 domain-containing protein [Prevotellaceae bacterium]
MLSRFGCVLAPDFSTYTDMPAPMARWQVYRRRFLCQWMQRTGIPCAYTVQTMGAEYDDDQLSGVETGAWWR